MPGNEVGDRVHNFFGQENLSQGQRHPQATDGNWPGLSNNLWVGNQQQVGSPVNSSSKSCNLQPVADSERRHGSPSLHVPHGLNFMQSNLRPEFGRAQSQIQQPTANGYMHGHQMFQTRQNEANFLGVDTESDKQNLTSRGLSTPESRGSGPELANNNSARLETSESPVGFDFFGGQQQMSGQHLSMMQSLPRQQQPRISDMQQLQRQAMFTQIQDFQRQQQLQQLERQQQVFANQASSIAKQAAGNHSPALMNGVTINEASKNQWPPNVVAGNTNWLQRGASPVIQGGPSGHVLSHEQAQALRLMGFVPQQADQSVYGVPISSSTGTPGSYSHFQVEKPAMQQVSISRNSSPGNQYAAFSGPVGMLDGSLLSRQEFQGKSTIGPSAAQSLNSGFNLETLHRVNSQQRNEPIDEFQGRQELVRLSEPAPEKAVGQVAPSQGVATLDPTEEKILFGSDDNLWDAFGRSTNVGMGGSSILDGADIFGGLQSGTWSALMQSAVAETSSGDGGLQEEWCGPSFRNSEPPVGTQQASSFGSTNKQQSSWAGNLHSSSDLNSRPTTHFADANRPSTSGSFSSIQGFQQSGPKSLHERGDIFQTDSSHRFVTQSPEQGGKWLDHNSRPQPTADGSHDNYGTISHSSGREINANSLSSSWNRQERGSSQDNQPKNMSNGWNFTESVSTDGGNNLKNHGNQILSRHAEGGELKRGMHEEMSRAAGMWKTDSAPHSNVEVAHAKYASPQINREGSSINSAAKSNSSTGRAYRESQQHLTNNCDFWTPVDSSVNTTGKEGLGKNQHNLDKNHLILESSGNNFVEKGVVEMHGMEDNITQENSNAYLHASTGGMKQSVVSDAGNSRTLPGSKQHSSGNVGRNPSATRKFQYHPMGDVGLKTEPFSGRKHVTHSQAMSQQDPRGLKSHNQGSFGQSKFMGHADRNSMEIEKANIRGLDEPPSKSMLPGFAPSTSTPFDRSTGNKNNTPNKAASLSSQHMLELLHKVDQPREHGNATHFSPSDRNMSSEMPEVETSDGSVGHIQRSQSSVSQGYGLQLAPPSQRITPANHTLSSQDSSQADLGSGRVHPEMGEKSHAWLTSTAAVQSLPSSHDAAQRELRNSISGSSGHTGNKALAPQYHIQGGLSSSSEYGYPHSRSQLENQHLTAASGQVNASQSVSIPFDRLAFRPQQLGESSERAQANQSPVSSVQDKSEIASQDNINSAEASVLNMAEQSNSRGAAPKIPETDAEPSGTSAHQGAVSKVLKNVWTSIPFQQPLVTAEPSKAQSQLFKSQSQLQSNNHFITSSHDSRKLNEQDTQERGNGFSAFGVYSLDLQSSGMKEQPSKQHNGQQVSVENIQTGQKINVSQGKELNANNLEVSASNSAATQRDIEAFGRSLRPNISSHQSYSLLNQVQAMKSTESDGSDLSVKRLRGPDSGVETQQVSPQGGPQLSYGYNTMRRDSSVDHTPPPGDPKMLSFASKLGDARLSNASSQDMFAFSRKNPQSSSSGSNASSLRGEQSQVSPQMAPSWFDQYGTLKNGKLLPIHDTLRATMKTMEQPFIAGKPGDLHARQQMEEPIATSVASTTPQCSALKPASNEQLTPPLLLRPDATDEALTVDRPKKRKTATSELSPWREELTKVSQKLPNMRVADAEWAQATNRLAEKVEDESEVIEDGPPVFRSKKRLILTTQLVQQLLRPPPLAVLSEETTSSFESITYFASRLSLGDACTAVSCSRNDIQSQSPPDHANCLPEKLKTPERVRLYFPKVVEDFMDKARKLENDLLRLDKRTSILDLRVESQDLEKFSVINRFAKFHGRPQGDGVEASSSSDAHSNAQRTCPQKYVTALPVPRNLPDRVQCLSL
ncbi:uncharacterized protein LOC126793583 isoform X2 [Argentina anserina]|uniref:uncharacterized protein LOC126793583 isoform X2 n=1 Tax=Argentina anserina TaxID=57926 RepID=UPI0021768EF5|nr:uncharacterized protein LOC126793583 isoform X2 [Potentilla anserina]